MHSGKWITVVTGHTTGPDGVITPVYGRREVECAYTRTYHSALALTARLSPCARNLIDHLCTVMSGENVVSSSKGLRWYFVQRMKDYGVNYSDRTVQAAYMELVDAGLLLRVHRGVYRVNPLYFMKNKGHRRISMIKDEEEQ
jgi:hypothetical protein